MPHREIALHRLARLEDVGHDVAQRIAGRRPHVHVHAEPIERSVQLDLERRLQVHAGKRRHEPRDFRNRQLVGRDLQVQVRLRQVVLHGAIDRQRRFGRPERQLLDVHRVVVHRHAARQRVQRDRRLRAAERHMRDFNRVPNGLVLERQLRVDVIEPLRHFDAARPDRSVDDHRAVADANLFDRDRSARPLSVGLLRLLLHQPAQLPRVAFAPQVDDRLVQPNLVDRQPFRDELEHVVVEAEVLDGHDLAAVHRDADVLHLDAGEQIPGEPFDRHRAVQIQIRLADDVAAQPVLEPRGLRHDDGRGRRADDEREHDDEHVNEALDDPHQNACPMEKWMRQRRLCGCPLTSRPGIGLSW